MTDEISRCLKKIGTELENVNKALNSIWYSRYQNGETDVLDPRCHADEYITLEVCAKRLHVTPQTIRNSKQECITTIRAGNRAFTT
jgi:hypothetical protein